RQTRTSRSAPGPVRHSSRPGRNPRCAAYPGGTVTGAPLSWSEVTSTRCHHRPSGARKHRADVATLSVGSAELCGSAGRRRIGRPLLVVAPGAAEGNADDPAYPPAGSAVLNGTLSSTSTRPSWMVTPGVFKSHGRNA